MAVTQSLTITESSPSALHNQSSVRILWKSTQSGASGNEDTKTAKYYVSINGGAETEYTVSYTLPKNATKTILDKTIRVDHKDDGTGTVKVRTFMYTDISTGLIELTETLNLTKIERATTLDELTSARSLFSDLLSFKYTPQSASLYNRCYIQLFVDGKYTGVKSIYLGRRDASQQTNAIKFSESELSHIYSKLPRAEKGTLRVTLYTYSDSGYSNQIGDGSYKEITLTIPNIDDTQPTATMTLTPVSSLAAPFSTLYIKGKSKVKVSLASGEGKYGATITSCKVSVAGKGGDSPYTSGYLVDPGSVTIKGTVTDSRGFSRTYTTTITVLDYSAPKIIPISTEREVIAARCDSAGNLSETGTYLKIKAKRSYTKVNVSGTNKNLCSIMYRYKAERGSYSDWTTILDATASSDQIVTGALLGTLDIKSTYYVQVRAEDTIGEEATATISVPTERVYMHKAGSINAFALGKYAEEENSLDVAEDWTAIFRGEVRFAGEAWESLGTNVAVSSVNSGRCGGSGVFYRVCAGGKHVYVAFNVSFTTSSGTVRAESYTIPYRPSYDVYALCPVGFADGSRGIATVSVSTWGEVNIYAVHKLPGATLSTGETVNWIDGYIDYWI